MTHYTLVTGKKAAGAISTALHRESPATGREPIFRHRRSRQASDGCLRGSCHPAEPHLVESVEQAEKAVDRLLTHAHGCHALSKRVRSIDGQSPFLFEALEIGFQFMQAANELLKFAHQPFMLARAGAAFMLSRTNFSKLSEPSFCLARIER